MMHHRVGEIEGVLITAQVAAASHPNVRFVHMRQFQRIEARRRARANGGFAFSIPEVRSPDATR